MKGLVFGILIILISVNIGGVFAGDAEIKTIPSSISITAITGNIITVDDEHGDADFSSIKEAVDYSSPGDIIEVYSGTYPEDDIRIVKENITLLGVSHELGEGNDSGKPFIKGDGTALVIHVEASHVIVSNFRIENPYAHNLTSYYCILVETTEENELNNITISDCIIHNTPKGIRVGDVGKNNIIIHNEISNCTYGIIAIRQTYRFLKILNITGNVITDCHTVGIRFDGTRQNVSGNIIRRCGTGLDVYSGSRNIVYGNDINDCPVGIISRGGRHTITKNNFKNYSLIGCWWERDWYISIWDFFGFLYDKDIWIGNYWDTWTGIGSMKILGKLTIGINIFNLYLLQIPIPRFDNDWNPAQEPYDIPRVAI